MEQSKLYDLLGDKLLKEWREEVEREESETWLFREVNETLDILESELNDKGKKLLASYTLALENKMDYLHYNLTIKILNLAVKIGMELQKAFAEHE